jgi:hypothetical protein
MTSWAFATVFPWFPVLLSLTAFLFAYSTMISWSYYGEQCWAHLFGVRSILVYKLIFLLFTWLGAIFQAQAVLDFGDMMILGMAFPNLIGVVLLSGKLHADFDSYWRRLRERVPRCGRAEPAAGAIGTQLPRAGASMRCTGVKSRDPNRREAAARLLETDRRGRVAEHGRFFRAVEVDRREGIHAGAFGRAQREHDARAHNVRARRQSDVGHVHERGLRQPTGAAARHASGAFRQAAIRGCT